MRQESREYGGFCRFIDHHLIYTPAIPLASGTRLGSYEILSALGAGGMGEVYRARDTKLNRDVAIKVLIPAVAGDPDRLARFSREAQVLASLNHPNIAAIYGIEESGGVTALVMELVEGEDLSQRISRGAIPIDEALPIARQLAEALEAAHELRIIHRDLKPANIKVRPDGTVKVLDFGLAKAVDPTAGSSATAMNSPTLSIHATEAGLILGTAAYMSPEQAAGKSVDKRTDLWAFGVVLLEMLTGRQVFPGESVSHVLAAVLKDTPDWTALPAATPPSIRTLLRRCLERDRKLRLSDAAVARLEIEDAGLASAVDPHSTTSRRQSKLAWSLVVLFAALTAGLMTMAVMRPDPLQPAMYRTTLALDEDLNQRSPPNRFAISPNGRLLAYVGRTGTGVPLLWLRSLDGSNSVALPGTDGASGVFWSPDSRFIAYFARGKLNRVEASGGTPIAICDVPLSAEQPGPGSWNRDGVIIFPAGESVPLQRVAAAGGPVSAVSALNGEAGETHHSSPFFLPDGRRFFFVAYKGTAPIALYVGSLDSGTRVRLLDGVGGAQYSGGAMVFVKGRTLMAQRFDSSTLALSGEAVRVTEQVQVGTVNAHRAAAFSVSETGALVYQGGVAGGGNSRLLWLNRAGQETAVLDERAPYRDVWLSPDSRQALVSLFDDVAGQSDLWLVDAIRRLRTRLTFDPADESDGIWSPDGTEIVFSSRRTGRLDLYRTLLARAGSETALLADQSEKRATSWSADRRYVLYSFNRATTGSDLWVLPLSGPDKPFPFAETSFHERWGQFSPDGRWVAYSSTESGRAEIYVAPFPGPGRKWQISNAGGDYPKWRRSGAELFYQSPDNKLMAAIVKTGGGRVDVERVQSLFAMQAPGGGIRNYFDVSADGQRFLLSAPDGSSASTPPTLVINWPALLEKKP